MTLAGLASTIFAPFGADSSAAPSFVLTSFVDPRAGTLITDLTIVIPPPGLATEGGIEIATEGDVPITAEGAPAAQADAVGTEGGLEMATEGGDPIGTEGTGPAAPALDIDPFTGSLILA